MTQISFVLSSRAKRGDLTFVLHLKMLGVEHQSVRLACVKHAASVRPEPGSNSPINFIRKPKRLFKFFVSL